MKTQNLWRKNIMKLRKVMAIVIACAVFAGLSLTASAAIDLGDLTWVNQANQAGWHADGFEEGSGDIIDANASTADWQAAKYLVIELTDELEGAGIQIVWQGADADGEGGSAWNQTDLQVADLLVGDKLVFELATALKDYDVFSTRAQVKVLLGYWEEDVADIIAKAYLTNEAPSAGGGNEGGSENGAGTPPEGNKPVETGIADVAVASAIALVAVGAVVFSRKRK